VDTCAYQRVDVGCRWGDDCCGASDLGLFLVIFITRFGNLIKALSKYFSPDLA
jgi:hypothetical protein